MASERRLTSDQFCVVQTSTGGMYLLLLSEEEIADVAGFSKRTQMVQIERGEWGNLDHGTYYLDGSRLFEARINCGHVVRTDYDITEVVVVEAND